MSNEIVLKINLIEYDILKAIGSLILLREGETNNHKTITINANSVSRQCGRSYKATKKYLKKLKDL